MGSKVEAPKPRDYGAETEATLQAQLKLAPELYGAEAEYQPKYAALERQKLRDALLGTSAAGDRGLLDILTQDVAPRFDALQAESLRRQREADISAVETLGPRASAAFKAANPEQAALLASLNQQAQQELGAGAALDPALAREVQQQVRGAQAARGVGFGPADVLAEAAFTGQAAENLRRRRQQFAMQTVGINQAVTADPFMAVLGRGATSPGAAQAFLGQARGLSQGGPGLFSPESAYAGDIYSSNFQAAMDTRLANAQMQNALLGAGIEAFGSAAGGALGKWCWVARAVFGEWDPRWVVFRAWLHEDAPAWLVEAYGRYGPRVAQWIRRVPRWMVAPLRWGMGAVVRWKLIKGRSGNV